MLKYKLIFFEIKSTEAILSNRTMGNRCYGLKLRKCRLQFKNGRDRQTDGSQYRLKPPPTAAA